MSDVKHVPLPWKVFNGTDISPDDNDTDGTRHIADCDMVNNISGDEARANAAFIVRACNSHYDLLEALKVCASIIHLQNGNLHQDTNAILLLAKAAVDKAEDRE